MPNTPQLVDTHCHIHEAGYPVSPEEVLIRAREAGVATLLCVGTNEQSSHEAIEFAAARAGVYATVGVHPHDTKDGYGAIAELVGRGKVVAVGEIGLDYYYGHSPRDTQIAALEAQLQIARDHKLPVSFHVREAASAERRTSVWNDFWPILGNFPELRGVLHSFTDSQDNLERGLSRGLYVAVNGISTFTKDERQKAMFMAIPLDRLLLETDAPFLTPTPFRGKVNEPGMVREIAKYHAAARGLELDELAQRTTANAEALFRFASAA